MVIAISDALLADMPGLSGLLGKVNTPADAYQAFTAPLSNKGNPTSTMNKTDNSFAVGSNTPVRLVNNATGEIAYQGTGFGATQEAIDLAQNLSSTGGKKASWELQIAPGAGTTWNTVAKEKKNSSVLGTIADIALPVAGSLIPGVGPILGAALGSTASSVAQGRSLENTLLRAGFAAGGSALGGAAFGKGTDAIGSSISNTANNAINAAYQAAQQGAGSALSGIYGSALGSAAGAGAGAGAGSVGGLLGDIVVTGSRNVAPSFGSSVAGSLGASSIPSFFDNAQLNNMQSGAQTDTQQPTDGGDIVVTGTRNPPVNLNPGSVLGSTAGSVIPPVDGSVGPDLVVNAKVNPPPSLTDSLLSGAASTVLPEVGPLDTPTSKSVLDNLTKNLGVTDYLTLASLLGSAVAGGGGGGTTAGTPYVSPFGTGGTMAGGDFRANPTIADYEQYGFGPEASFFRPDYYNLVSGGAAKGYTPPAGTTTTPTYKPLISGGGGSTTTGGATTGGTTGGATAVTKQERPAGFTGVVVGQQVGDTQVVDGTTWVWGGDNVGWQMQYKSPETGNLALLPGNGATNVSSFANNPTVEVNQPYFAQNTAIPDWATTYQGFQRGLINAGVTGDAKAAAERELFTAIETMPFANATELVDYAKGIYNKYTGRNVPTTAGVLQATQSMQQQAMNANQTGDANQALATSLLNQAANYVAPNGFTPPAGTVLQSPEWDKLYLDYTTGKSTVRPPRLVGFTEDEFQRRLDAQIERGAENAQQTVDYWAAVRGDPRYAAAAQYEMTTGESAGGGPYLPSGYAAVGNSVMKIGTPQYEEAVRGLI